MQNRISKEKDKIMFETERKDVIALGLKDGDISTLQPNQTRLSYMQQIIPQIINMMKPKDLGITNVKTMALYAWMMQQSDEFHNNFKDAFIVTPEEIKAFQPVQHHRPLINGVLLQRRIIPMLKTKMASFEWAPPINVAYLPPDSRLYRCVLAKEGDWSKRRFDGTTYKWVFTSDEIYRMARTIIGGYVDHNHMWFDPLEDAMVIDAEGAKGLDGKTRLEAFIFTYGHSTLDYAYDNQQIVGTSIEFMPREETNLGNDRFEEKGNRIFGVAYLTGRTPSSQGTSLELIAIGKPMSKTIESEFESSKMEKAEIEAMLKPNTDAIAALQEQLEGIYTAKQLDEKLAALSPLIKKEDLDGLNAKIGEIKTTLGDLVNFKTAVLEDLKPDQKGEKNLLKIANQESLNNDQSDDIGQHKQDKKDANNPENTPQISESLKLAQENQEKEWQTKAL
jgi:hypothetical protein